MEKLKKLMEDIDMPAEAAERVLAAELPFPRTKRKRFRKG